MKQAVQITVLGKQFALRSGLDPEEVVRIAAFVNEKIAEATAGKAVDSLNSAILALLNLGGAHLRLCEERRQEKDVAARLALLLERLEKAMPEPPPK